MFIKKQKQTNFRIVSMVSISNLQSTSKLYFRLKYFLIKKQSGLPTMLNDESDEYTFTHILRYLVLVNSKNLPEFLILVQ